MNSRLDTIQAAVLNVKLRYLESWNSARRNHAAAYRSHLDGLSGITQTVNNAGCVYHLLVIRVDDRDRVLQALHDDNIGAGIHYPFALHELGMFKDLGYAAGEFPVAEDWARRCLSLPIYPELPLEAVTRATAILRRETERVL